MYKYYNANPLGKMQSDCFLRALSCATSKSWDYIYEKISDIAQSQGMMMDDREFVRDYLDYKYERVPYMDTTVGQLAEEYSDYIMLITMNGHITCSRFGIIYDSFDPRNRIAENAWIVE